jgi:hypothetical protein
MSLRPWWFLAWGVKAVIIENNSVGTKTPTVAVRPMLGIARTSPERVAP